MHRIRVAGLVAARTAANPKVLCRQLVCRQRLTANEAEVVATTALDVVAVLLQLHCR